jgi:hypothetical protein
VAPAGSIDQMSENELELVFCANPDKLEKALGVSNLVVFRQIPVGLFDGEKAKSKRVFPGGKGAIDLCAFDGSGTTNIFELKKPDNYKVGAISELLFYSHIIYDLQREVFSCLNSKTDENIESNLIGTKRIRAYILAEKLHPLLDYQKLFELLNNSFGKRKTKFGFVSCDDKMSTKPVYKAI